MYSYHYWARLQPHCFFQSFSAQALYTFFLDTFYAQWSAKMATHHSKGKKFVISLILLSCLLLSTEAMSSSSLKELLEDQHSLSSHQKNVQTEIIRPTCLFLFVHIICVQWLCVLPAQLIRSAGCCAYWFTGSLGCYKWAAENCPFLYPVLVAELRHPERDTRLKNLTPLIGKLPQSVWSEIQL